MLNYVTVLSVMLLQKTNFRLILTIELSVRQPTYQSINHVYKMVQKPDKLSKTAIILQKIHSITHDLLQQQHATNLNLPSTSHLWCFAISQEPQSMVGWKAYMHPPLISCRSKAHSGWLQDKPHPRLVHLVAQPVAKVTSWFSRDRADIHQCPTSSITLASLWKV